MDHEQLFETLLVIDRGRAKPLYLQLVQSLREAIDAGHLHVGERLPSERRLARQFGLSRTTVQSAYAELTALGLLKSVPGSGTFVARRPLSAVPKGTGPLQRVMAKRKSLAAGTFLEDLMRSTSTPPEYNFDVGMPDPQLLPLHEFELVILDLFSNRSRQALSHSPSEGILSLRQAIASSLLPMRGLTGVQPDNIMIVTGSMQGLDLVAKLFVEPGDAVVLENLTFPGAIQTFRAAGAEVLSVPVDKDGMQVDALEQLLQRRRPKLIYTQPVLQNPTGAALVPARRRQLLALATEYGIPVLEDDAYGLLAAEAPGLLPLKTEDEHGVVIYLSTFSKVVSPGLRVGYLVADAGIIRELARFKQLADLHTSTISQLLVEGWLATGSVRAHVQRCRDVYAKRIRTALSMLEGTCALQPFLKPIGGFYVFLRLPVGLRAAAVESKSFARGIAFARGGPFSTDGSFDDHIRLCVATVEGPTISNGIQRLLRLLEEMDANHPMQPVS